MRVLQVGAFPFPAPFGSQLYVSGLSRALAQRGHQVSLATFSGEGQCPEGVRWIHSDRARWANPIRSGPHWGRWVQDALLVRSLRAFLATHPVDLIHAHHVEGVLTARLARGRRPIPIVYGMHTSLAEELPDWWGPWAGPLGELIDRGLPFVADGTLCLSDRELTGSPLPIDCAPPGYFPEELMGADGDRARRRWGVGPGPLAVYVGNADPYQHLPDLLEAMVHWPEGRLLLVLTSSSDSLRRLARERGLSDRVYFAHSRSFEDAKDAIAAADVGVIPRRQCAGFPMKLLNFLGLGCPVVAIDGVASPCEGLRLVRSGSADLLAREIADVSMRTGRLVDAEGLRRCTEAHFSWSVQSERVEFFYQRVLDNGRTRSLKKLQTAGVQWYKR